MQHSFASTHFLINRLLQNGVIFVCPLDSVEFELCVCVSSHNFMLQTSMRAMKHHPTHHGLSFDFACQTKIVCVYFVIRICVYLYLFYFNNNNNNINMYALFTLNLWCQPFVHYTTANKCTYAHTHTRTQTVTQHYLYLDGLTWLHVSTYVRNASTLTLTEFCSNKFCVLFGCVYAFNVRCSIFHFASHYLYLSLSLSGTLSPNLPDSRWHSLSRSLCLCVCVLILLTLCLGYLISSAHTPKPLKCIKIRVRRRRYGKM